MRKHEEEKMTHLAHSGKEADIQMGRARKKENRKEEKSISNREKKGDKQYGQVHFEVLYVHWIPLRHPSAKQNPILLILDDNSGRSSEVREHLSICYDDC